MKKSLLALVCLIAFSVSAFAQKGQSAVGLNLGYSIGLDEPKPKNFEIGAKYQYNISDPIRLEAAFNYGFKNKVQGVDFSVMDYNLNAHYLVNVAEQFKFYPIVGLGALTAKASVGDYSSSETKFAANVGVGGELALGEKLALNLEIKYQYCKDFGTLPIRLGLAYKF